MRLRAATSQDAAAIAELYAPYVSASTVSFEMEPPSAEAMRSRIEERSDLYPWIVAEDEVGLIAGYAYATAFRQRLAYRFTVETSVYVGQDAQGQGLGARLYRSLFATLESQGFAQAIAAITLPNAASLRLHERLGFSQAGLYSKVGHKFGSWHDVAIWQRPLAPMPELPREPRPLADAGLVLC